MTRLRRTLLAPALLLLVPALLLAGCGGSSSSSGTSSPTPSPSAATPSVDVPAGVTLTDPGTKLSFGDSATVPYRPNDKRSSVLRLTVTAVTRASMRDFSAYVLDRRARNSTPYYVRVKVVNVGKGDVGGTDVPLWAVNQRNVLIHSSSFTNSFTACPSGSLPQRFGPTDRLSTCLVYLVPRHGTLTAVSFRPLQAFEPIQWTGKIPGPGKKHAKKKS